MNMKRMALIVLLIIAGAAGIYFIGNHTSFMGPGHYSNWGMMGSRFYSGHMMMGGMMHLIFWLVLFFFLISAFSSRRSLTECSSDSAVEILKKQFVNGNIDKAEFIEKMKYLNK